MKKINTFIKTTILGGVAVILPAAILLSVFKWTFGLVTQIIRPLTQLVMVKSQIQEFVANILVICIILAICFILGIVVKTKVGLFVQKNLENHILKVFPGYTMIKEIVMPFFDKKKTPFSSVALVQIFENDTLMTAFVTDSHPDGSYTVFVPTGPNPTSGGVFHLKAQYVHHVDISVEKAMRSVISCGVGSAFLIDAYANRTSKTGTVSSSLE
ncbi:MAG: DUF502 domain-containing protein [Desulfatiglandaceae bacterium]